MSSIKKAREEVAKAIQHLANIHPESKLDQLSIDTVITDLTKVKIELGHAEVALQNVIGNIVSKTIIIAPANKSHTGWNKDDL